MLSSHPRLFLAGLVIVWIIAHIIGCHLDNLDDIKRSKRE